MDEVGEGLLLSPPLDSTVRPPTLRVTWQVVGYAHCSATYPCFLPSCPGWWILHHSLVVALLVAPWLWPCT